MQIDPLFVQSSSKYRPGVAQREPSEIWREETRVAGNRSRRKTGGEAGIFTRVEVEHVYMPRWFS